MTMLMRPARRVRMTFVQEWTNLAAVRAMSAAVAMMPAMMRMALILVWALTYSEECFIMFIASVRFNI